MITIAHDHFGLREGDTLYRLGKDRWGRRVNSIVKYTVARFTKTQMILAAENGGEVRIKLDDNPLSRARVVGSAEWTSGLVYPDSDELTRAQREVRISRAQYRAHAVVDKWLSNREDLEAANAASAALLEYVRTSSAAP